MAHGESPNQTQAWVTDIEPQGEGIYASAAFSSVQGVIDHGLTLPPSDRSSPGAAASSHEEFHASISSNESGITGGNSMRGGSSIGHLHYNDYKRPESPDSKLGLTGNITPETLPSIISPSSEGEELTRDPSATTWSASCQSLDNDSHGMALLELDQSTVPGASLSNGDPQPRIPTGNILKDAHRSQPVCAEKTNVPLPDNRPYERQRVNHPQSYGRFPVVSGIQNLQPPGGSVECALMQNAPSQSNIPVPSIEGGLPKKLKSAPLLTAKDCGRSTIPWKAVGKIKPLGDGTHSPLFLNHVRPTEHDLSQNHLCPAETTRGINPQEPEALIASPSVSKPALLLHDLPLPLSICVAISDPLQRQHTLSTIAELQALLCDTSAEETRTTFQPPAIPAELRAIFDRIFERWKIDSKYRKQLLFLMMEKLEQSSKKGKPPRPLPLTPRDIDKILALLVKLAEGDEGVETASKPGEVLIATLDGMRCLCSTLRSGKLLHKCLKAFKNLELADEIRRNAKQVEQLYQQQTKILQIQEQKIRDLSLECFRLKELSTYETIAPGVAIPDANSPEKRILVPDDFKPSPDRSYHFAEPVDNQYWLCLLPPKQNLPQPCLGLNQSWMRDKSAKTVWTNRVRCGSCKRTNASSHTRQYISREEAADRELTARIEPSRPIPQQSYSPAAIGLDNRGVRAGQTPGPPTIPTAPHASHVPNQPVLFPEIIGQYTKAGSVSPSSRQSEQRSAPSTGPWQPDYTNSPYSMPTSSGSPTPTPGLGEYSGSPHPYSITHSQYQQHREASYSMNNTCSPSPIPELSGAQKGHLKSQPATYKSKFHVRGATPGVLTFPASPQTLSIKASNKSPNDAIGMFETAGHKRAAPSTGQHNSIHPEKRLKKTASLSVNKATVDTLRTALPGIKRSWMNQNTTASVAQHKARPECIIIPDDEPSESQAPPAEGRNNAPKIDAAIALDQSSSLPDKSKVIEGASNVVHRNVSSSMGQLVDPEQTELEPDVSFLFDCDDDVFAESIFGDHGKFATFGPSDDDTNVNLERDMEEAMKEWDWGESVVSDEIGREGPGMSAEVESGGLETWMETDSQEPLAHHVQEESEESEE